MVRHGVVHLVGLRTKNSSVSNRIRVGSSTVLPVLMQSRTSCASRVVAGQVMGIAGRDHRQAHSPGDIDRPVAHSFWIPTPLS